MDRPPRSGAPNAYDETIFADPELIAGEKLSLREERASLVKRQLEGRRAIITRRVVAVRKTIEVDVLHEELQIDYLPGTQHEVFGEAPEKIVVRLHAEDVEIVKHVRVVEEVVISKRRVAERRSLAVDLKREELEIEETNSPPA